MESMQKEFDSWSEELARNQALINKGSQWVVFQLKALKSAFRQNDASLQSLYDELDTLVGQISSKRNDINATKQKIHTNKNLIERQVKMMLSA